MKSELIRDPADLQFVEFDDRFAAVRHELVESSEFMSVHDLGVRLVLPPYRFVGCYRKINS